MFYGLELLYHCNTMKDESTKHLIRVQCVVYTRSMERDGDTVVRDCHTGDCAAFGDICGITK